MNHLPADVRVSGMLVAAGRLFLTDNQHLFKRYTYKGTGEDTLTAHMDAPKPKPKRKPQPTAYERRPKPKRKRFWKPEPVYYTVPEPPPEPKFPTDIEPLPRPPRVIRPAPGWEPMSGAELDRLFDELEGTAPC